MRGYLCCVKGTIQLCEIAKSAIKRMKKAYGGIQTAIISLPVESGIKLITAGKVKIGWAVCRLSEQVSLKRCFGFSHFAAECTSEHDISRKRRKCGDEGHLIKDCSGDLQCMLCKGKKRVDDRQVAGGGKCPAFRKEPYREVKLG